MSSDLPQHKPCVPITSICWIQVSPEGVLATLSLRLSLRKKGCVSTTGRTGKRTCKGGRGNFGTTLVFPLPRHKNSLFQPPQARCWH
ncbi:hypothetical protein LEMLEM_LOCUS17437 [Lemmus lemmus]